MPQTRVRVVGSGFTTFHYRGKAIAFLDQFRDSGTQAVGTGGAGGGPGWEPITPLGANRPVEIATSRVMGPGTITASIRELWNEPIWQQLSGLKNAHNLVDVWQALARDTNPVSCQMIIKPPGNAGPNRKKVYHNCVVTAINDGETVTIGALSVAKDIEIVYTHATYGGNK